MVGPFRTAVGGDLPTDRPADRRRATYLGGVDSVTPPVEIVVGVVLRDDGRFLVQPRSGDRAMAGLWELPGGKRGPDEDPHAALVREIEEETGLAVRVDDEPLCALSHAYPDRRVTLRVYRCEPLGEPRPPRWTRWVTAGEYRSLPMPEANAAIVAAIERAGAASGSEPVDSA